MVQESKQSFLDYHVSYSFIDERPELGHLLYANVNVLIIIKLKISRSFFLKNLTSKEMWLKPVF